MGYNKKGEALKQSTENIYSQTLGTDLEQAIKDKKLGVNVKNTLEGGEIDSPPSVAAVVTGLSAKADKTEVNVALQSKANVSDLNSKASVSDLNSKVATLNSAIQSKADSSQLSGKQDKLVSGTNIKTINGNSILGSGNITIQGGSGGGSSVDIDTSIPASPTDTKVPSTKLLAAELAKKANAGAGGLAEADAKFVTYTSGSTTTGGNSVADKLTELEKGVDAVDNALFNEVSKGVDLTSLMSAQTASSYYAQSGIKTGEVVVSGIKFIAINTDKVTFAKYNLGSIGIGDVITTYTPKENEVGNVVTINLNTPITLGTNEEIALNKFKFKGTSGYKMYNVSTGTYDNNYGISINYIFEESKLVSVENDIEDIKSKIGNVAEKSVIKVAKDGSGDFDTINKAMACADTYMSKSKPVTILVYPGTYAEVVNVLGKRNLSIVGVNRDNCIIRDDSGRYTNCPLRISGNSYVANLTLISTHKNDANFVTSGTLNQLPSYGIHIDDRHDDDDADYVCTIQNCKIYSEQNPAIGMGLDKRQTVNIFDCELITNETEDMLALTTSKNWAHKPEGGALFFHAFYPSTSGYTDTNPIYQHLVVKNCIIRSNNTSVKKNKHYAAFNSKSSKPA